MVLSTSVVSATEENGTINNTATTENLTEDPTSNTTNQYAVSYAEAASVTFTQEEIIQANQWVKNYIETNQKLPNYVTINSINVNMPSFLRLITTLTQKINNKDTTPIEYILCNNPTTPKDNQKMGTMTKTLYITIAGKVQRYMDANLKAPNYSSYSNLGTYFGYQNMIYTFSNILVSYKNNINKELPTRTAIVPWTYITNYAGTFTIQQTTTAATYVKNYIETNQKLPDNVPITGTNLKGDPITTTITLPAYLKLITTITQKINNKDTTPTPLANIYQNPTTPKDNQKTGTMTKALYITIAGKVQRYMDANLKTPSYSSYSNLGSYFGYHNMIYTFSNILVSYKNSATGNLPTTTTIVPWTYITNFAGTFTITQTTEAATWVKNYIEQEEKLPANVPISGTNLKGDPITTTITLPAYLKLITTTIQKINNQDTTPTPLANIYQNPTTPQDEIHSGNMPLSTYLDIAGRVQRYMDTNLKATSYSSYSNLGSYFGYQNMIYTFSNILVSYSNSGTGDLPTTTAIVPWNRFTWDQVASAASYVKNYVDANHRLPSYVTISGVKVGMASFLGILTTTVYNIFNNIQDPIYYNYCLPASDPCDSQVNGQLDLGNYTDIAGRVQRYMNLNWKAPNYSSNSPLGSYFGYHNMVYTFSRIMAYYGSNNDLPDYATVKPWIQIILPQLASVPDSYLPYTKPSANCQSNNSAIVSLAYKLASGCNSLWEVGTKIFNWVRDNIGYSFYYNTKYGAVGTLNKRSANCVDTAHLVVALARSIGLPAKYRHGYCRFTYSGNWYGHVWAQIYIPGKKWYDADGTSYRNSLGVIKNWDTGSYKNKGTYISLPF